MKTNSVHPTECTDLNLLRKAHTAAKAVPLSQDTCWPVPYCDDSRCRVTDHTEAVNAVQASEGLVWEFDRWTSFARTLLGRICQLTGSTEPDRVIIHSQAGGRWPGVCREGAMNTIRAWRGRGQLIDSCVYIEVNGEGGIFLADMESVTAADDLVNRINNVTER